MPSPYICRIRIRETAAQLVFDDFNFVRLPLRGRRLNRTDAANVYTQRSVKLQRARRV
jgi:hypothetical protein